MWSLLALLAGVLLVAALATFIPQLLSPAAISFDRASGAEAQAPTQDAPADFGEGVHVAERSLGPETALYETRTLPAASLAPPEQGKAIVADLAEMMLRVYEDGTVVEEYPIRSKGRPGSLWETPTGRYAIKTKEENHYSTIGNVWMPSSMQFFGNFFIHGGPYYPNGAPVPEGLSGGCIRLSTEDAAKVFSTTSLGVPVIVTNGAEPGVDVREEATAGSIGYRGVQHFVPPPAVSAKSAIVGDLENGFIFYEKNASEARSIASLSKLMTALISLEAVNQSRVITITPEDTDIYGDAGGLKAGEKYEAGELLLPLLLSSSNDAAYALARPMGEKAFVALMNEKAASLGLTDTTFVEPSGLDPGNLSTSIDLFRFTQHLWESKRSVLDITRAVNRKAWRNIHPFAPKSSFLGGKTGFIPEAGRTILATFSVPFGEFDERTVAIVALGSDDVRGDVERLRVWAKDNFYYGLDAQPTGAPVRYTVARGKTRSEAFSLLFAGDIMLDRSVRGSVAKNGAGDWAFPFAKVKDELRAADVTFANLEGPVSDSGAKAGSIYSFRMDPAVIPALVDAGIDIVSLANNHIGDWGREALEDTMRRFRRAGMQFAGAGWNSVEAEGPAHIQVDGKTVGYLAFSDVGPAWLSAKDAQSGIAVLPQGTAGMSTVEKAVRQAKDHADIIVVSFHFGDEYAETPTKRQRELARIAVDAGARIVVGHHPHVVQRIEEYNGGVIAYSLGNFIFDQYFSEETMTGLMLKVEFQGDAISAVIPIPISLNEFYQPAVE